MNGPWLTVKAAAHQSGLSCGAVLSAIESGELPASEVAGYQVVLLSDLRAYLMRLADPAERGCAACE